MFGITPVREKDRVTIAEPPQRGVITLELLVLLMIFGLLVIPFVPAIIEYYRRKGKGPRVMAEKTADEVKPIADVPGRERARQKDRSEPHREPSTQEIFEEILASKMRDELKKKIEAETRQS